MTASLQHPLIVPVLSAGSAADQLYYTMPFVEGEPLRDRLVRDGALSTADTVHVLHDVVDALAYAHARRVVHRDITPANVLISGTHAMVTDFGVAKAVSASSDDRILTSVGLALGTPTYMAPEQALGEPGVDHRADLYAVGVMAYEMLVGRPPFTGMTAQQLLVAQAVRTPEPVATHRSDVPPALELLVMQLLAKEPGDRVQSASELLAQLESIKTTGAGRASAETTSPPSPASPAFRPVAGTTQGMGHWFTWHREIWRGSFWRGALVVIALAVIAGAWMTMRQLGNSPRPTLVSSGAIRTRAPVILANFVNRTADSTLGATLTEAFRVDLSQSPTVRLVSAQAIADALARMRQPPGTVLSPEVARSVAQREGVAAVVQGEIDPAGRGYVLAASVVSPADGAVLTAVRETAASDAELIPALERLSRELRKQIGESLASIGATPLLDHVTTSSFEALRKYSEAMRLDGMSDYEGAIPLLQDATRLDTGFAMAWRKLADRLAMVGGSNADVIAAAMPTRSP